MGPLNVSVPTTSTFAKLNVPNRNGSMPAIPMAPFVMLTGCDRLFRKIRMISPKPSVTIAR